MASRHVYLINIPGDSRSTSRTTMGTYDIAPDPAEFGWYYTGYYFAGWANNADGTGELYQPGEDITFGPYAYAIWLRERRLVFNGFDTQSTNAIIIEGDIATRPNRDIETIAAAGRSGSLLRDNKRYGNVDMTYWVVIPSDFENTYRQFRDAFLPPTGYCRLEDSFDRDVFYMAYVSETLSPIVTRDRTKGKFKVTFSRMPERWLYSGEEPQPIVQKTASDVTFDGVYYPGYVGATVVLPYPNTFPLAPRVKIRVDADMSEDGIKEYSTANLLTILAYAGADKKPAMLEYSINRDGSSWETTLSQGDIVVIDFMQSTMTNVTKGIDLLQYLYIPWTTTAEKRDIPKPIENRFDDDVTELWFCTYAHYNSNVKEFTIIECITQEYKI